MAAKPSHPRPARLSVVVVAMHAPFVACRPRHESSASRRTARRMSPGNECGEAYFSCRMRIDLMDMPWIK
jgi:cobalamin biosynthesis protein CobD/CbiB